VGNTFKNRFHKLMREIVLGLLTIISLTTFGQETEERILYVVDSIAIVEDPKEDECVLSENGIETITVVTNETDINKYGHKNIDKIIFIITKEFAKRPEEIRRVPTFKKMFKNGTKWCLEGTSIPYTGTFIDYYYNGKKYRDGFLKDGLLDGLRTIYYQDGKKKYYGYFFNGTKNGEYGEYFINGQLQQQGIFKEGKEEGLWKEWYSTGVLKKEVEYKNGKPILNKETEKLDKLFTNGLKAKEEGNYKGAVKFYDKAIELSPNFSDLYFHRSRAYLYDLQFDEAIADCDKAIEIEPLYMEAYSNRAFTRIRKYELGGSRVLSRNTEVTVLAGKSKTEIPPTEKDIICTDLRKGFELGDIQPMIKDAIKKYCE
jgi:antitoxin component YwqK of YwqJK toxin-antitoxin module